MELTDFLLIIGGVAVCVAGLWWLACYLYPLHFDSDLVSIRKVLRGEIPVNKCKQLHGAQEKGELEMVVVLETAMKVFTLNGGMDLTDAELLKSYTRQRLRQAIKANSCGGFPIITPEPDLNEKAVRWPNLTEED